MCFNSMTLIADKKKMGHWGGGHINTHVERFNLCYNEDLSVNTKVQKEHFIFLKMHG